MDRCPHCAHGGGGRSRRRGTVKDVTKRLDFLCLVKYPRPAIPQNVENFSRLEGVSAGMASDDDDAGCCLWPGDNDKMITWPTRSFSNQLVGGLI